MCSLFKSVTYTHIHLHTQLLAVSTWLGDLQEIPSASTNSLSELRMARYQGITITTVQLLIVDCFNDGDQTISSCKA